MSFFPVRKTHHLQPQWNPLAEMSALQDRFFDMFGRMDKDDLLAPGNIWSPSLDIVETDKEMTLKVDVPGMEKKDINVEIDQGDLIIKGERKLEKEEKKDNLVHIERNYGSFYRRLALPDYVDQDSIQATCNNGLLELKLNIVPGERKDVKSIEIK